MRRLIPALAAAAVLAPAAPALAGPSGPNSPKPTSYAIIGDIPYGSAMIAAFPGRIQQINADSSVSRVIHLGDIKNGSSRCDTSYFDLIRSDFDGFDDPFVYTPGDNEWTDCHRTNNGGYQPAGPVIAGPPVITAAPRSRLDEVRRIFFPTPGQTLGVHPAAVETQGGTYVENVRWQDAKTVFVTLNVPGSDNDGLAWFGAAETPALRDVRLAEQAERTAADIAWLQQAIKQAKAGDVRALVISIQADMWDPAITGDPSQYVDFTPFVRALADGVRGLKKPVLLLNGDSHVYESDKPLADPTATNNAIYGVDEAVPNLTRVTVDGSGNANDYLRLTIDPKRADPFSWSRVSYISS